MCFFIVLIPAQIKCSLMRNYWPITACQISNCHQRPPDIRSTIIKFLGYLWIEELNLNLVVFSPAHTLAPNISPVQISPQSLHRLSWQLSPHWNDDAPIPKCVGQLTYPGKQFGCVQIILLHIMIITVATERIGRFAIEACVEYTSKLFFAEKKSMKEIITPTEFRKDNTVTQKIQVNNRAADIPAFLVADPGVLKPRGYAEFTKKYDANYLKLGLRK